MEKNEYNKEWMRQRRAVDNLVDKKLKQLYSINMVDTSPLEAFNAAVYRLLRTENAGSYNKYDVCNTLADAYTRILRNKKHETRTTESVTTS